MKNTLNPKISVIVPVYNTAKYVESSVRSIMNQTYKNLEIICVNDGSTDNSMEILMRLKTEDNRIVIIDKQNEGLGLTRNKGMEIMTGEWVSFIDSDDTIREDTYEIVVKAIEEDPEIVHFGIQVVHEDGTDPIKSDDEYYRIKHEGLMELTESMVIRSDHSASNKVFKKSIIDQYGLSFEKIHYEDFAFVCQYMSVIKSAYYIPDGLYYYLRRQGSIMEATFKKTPHAIDHLKSFNYICEFLHKHNLQHEKVRTMRKLFVAAYSFAIRYGSVETLPAIVEYATEIYNKYPCISERVDKIKQNNTILFTPKKKRRATSKFLQFIFTLTYEYIDYRPHKVMKIFGILLYKSPR